MLPESVLDSIRREERRIEDRNRQRLHEKRAKLEQIAIDRQKDAEARAARRAPKPKPPACGAKTRAGGECRMKAEAGKKRCRLHGGLSTGPRTLEGRRRISEVQRRRWAAIAAERHPE